MEVMTVKETGELEYGGDGPSGAWNQGCEFRENHRGALRVPSASLSGRRRLRRWITRAFSPGYNMTGLRPCRTGVNSVAGKIVRSGKGWTGERNEVGKGGQEIGKWCSFSHFETALTRLFPHNSTQVVDFPHLARAGPFWEGKNSPQSRRDAEAIRACNQYGEAGRELDRCIRTSFAGMATERSRMFAYVRLKSRMFAYFEKKYFFPALWPPRARTQCVGVDATWLARSMAAFHRAEFVGGLKV
jgi:hypothetical protein